MTELCDIHLNHYLKPKKEGIIMDIINRFGRVGAVLLPVALLAVFFKYLHPINSALHEIGGVGARKTALTLFVSFFALWALIYLTSMIFIRITHWVWSGKSSSSTENRNFKDSSSIEEPLKNNINYQKTMEREALFKLDLQNEKDERAA